MVGVASDRRIDQPEQAARRAPSGQAPQARGARPDRPRRCPPPGPRAAGAPSQRYPSLVELADQAGELTRRHPGLCRLETLGRSRAGRPIPMLSVGEPAPRNVLVVAGPHANEPVGGPTSLRLAHAVLADPRLRDGTAWHLVPCIDPDAAARNEGWTTRPVTLASMHRHFYRPAFPDQAEWLPQRNPETRALTAALDRLRPQLMCSLHGVDVGGTFVQTTADIPGLAEPLGKSAAEHDMPVALAAPDAHQWPTAGPGHYVMPAGRPQNVVPLGLGVSGPTWTYPARYGGVTAIVEAPMWGSDAVGDPAPHHAPHRELHDAARMLGERSARVAALADGVDVEDGELLRAVHETVRIGITAASALPRRGGSGAAATRGRVADLAIIAHRLPLRAAAMLGRVAPRAVGSLVEEWAEEYGRATRARWIPVEQQVAHQAKVVLAANARV
ncbi:M14 family zinc carboxypeptidase [Mangrovactinospora gilvigrisea]|uniref:M14 family zinc carboxypeptidase n=1 Tax=Mangrovactinospora gilvigrisea TaxID=1428644 RepID=UPI001FEB3E07|nr:M14 family zinc carboxypeptidase [Mangrovactinospora gilvigrisea]